MSTQVLVWLGAVMVGLFVAACCGAVVWAAAWSVARVWNWRPWRRGLAEEDGSFRGDDQDVTTEALELPPERSWEQMTSHQLPVVGMSPAERKHWHKLERARKRRAARAEMTWRAHYAALGFEYPSGLMARVRELTP